jgi:hypothetical protein
MPDETTPIYMTQIAPYPHILHDLVGRLQAFPGWFFELVDRQTDASDSGGLRLEIYVRGVDSYDPSKPRGVVHSFIVPAATYNEQSWRRWLFDRCLDVQTHELCEFFRFVDGRPLCATCGLEGIGHSPCATCGVADIITRPYAPNHGPGNDPYFVFELGDREGQRTRNDGSLSPE